MQCTLQAAQIGATSLQAEAKESLLVKIKQPLNKQAVIATVTLKKNHRNSLLSLDYLITRVKCSNFNFIGLTGTFKMKTYQGLTFKVFNHKR